MKTTLNFMKKHSSVLMFAVIIALMFAEPALAWDAKVTAFMEKISTGLKAIGVATITVALMFAGYQIAFGGKTISAVAPIIIGGLVIGGAAIIANLIIA
jgi:type IV secretion system protein VirB2